MTPIKIFKCDDIVYLESDDNFIIHQDLSRYYPFLQNIRIINGRKFGIGLIKKYENE